MIHGGLGLSVCKSKLPLIFYQIPTSNPVIMTIVDVMSLLLEEYGIWCSGMFSSNAMVMI